MCPLCGWRDQGSEKVFSEGLGVTEEGSAVDTHCHHPSGPCCPCSSHRKPLGSPAAPTMFPIVADTCPHLLQHTPGGAWALWRLCSGQAEDVCISVFSGLEKAPGKTSPPRTPRSVCWQAEGLSGGSGTFRVCPLLGLTPCTLGSEAGRAQALGIGSVSYTPRGADKNW